MELCDKISSEFNLKITTLPRLKCFYFGFGNLSLNCSDLISLYLLRGLFKLSQPVPVWLNHYLNSLPCIKKALGIPKYVCFPNPLEDAAGFFKHKSADLQVGV